MVQDGKNGWFVRHAVLLKTLLRVVFGFIWALDGIFKFDPALVRSFPDVVAETGQGQPAWLPGWFSFWVYGTGLLEMVLAFSLVFGFLRKIAYVGGFVLSFFIWAVPEGFGGPYGPGST